MDFFYFEVESGWSTEITKGKISKNSIVEAASLFVARQWLLA